MQRFENIVLLFLIPGVCKLLDFKEVDNVNIKDYRTVLGGAERRIEGANVSADDRAFVSLSYYYLFSVVHFTLKFRSAFWYG